MMKNRVATSVLIERGLLDVCQLNVEAVRFLPRPIVDEVRKAEARLIQNGMSRMIHKSGMMADVIEAGLRSLGMLSEEFESRVAAEVAQSVRKLREANLQIRRRERAEARDRRRVEREARAEQAERERIEAEALERERAEAAGQAAAEEQARKALRAAIDADAAEGEAFLAAVGDDPTAIDALLQPSDDAVDAADAGDDGDADSAAESDNDAGDDSGDLEDDEDAVGDGAEPVGAVESEHR